MGVKDDTLAAQISLHFTLCTNRFKGALDKILKFSFGLNFIYHVKIDRLFINTKKKKNSKIPSKMEKIIIFC